MSLKTQQFAGIITNPLNIHNFYVSIPDADLSIIVSSTSFPSEKLRQVELYFQGEIVRYPTIPQNDGSWKIKLPENDDGKVRNQLDALKQNFYNQRTGIFIPGLWKDVEVFARDLAGNLVFSVILHGVWLKGRDTVQLQNNDPSKNWDWDYEFVFQWIEDKDYNNTAASNPMP